MCVPLVAVGVRKISPKGIQNLLSHDRFWIRVAQGDEGEQQPYQIHTTSNKLYVILVCQSEHNFMVCITFEEQSMSAKKAFCCVRKSLILT